MAESWGYTPENGPSQWARLYAPAATGRHQSPINIVPADAVYDAKLEETPLCVNFDAAQAQHATNNGNSCLVTYHSTAPTLQGGPLTDKYTLAQFHFHWGISDEEGSEHTVNGKSYAAELHLVHYNSDKYNSVDEALGDQSGLCVLGMFLEVGKEHVGLGKLTSKLKQIRYKGDKVDMHGFNTTCLLPERRVSDYWTYNGSLTIPPCRQCIKWIVFREPLHISEDQLTLFRRLHVCREANQDTNRKEAQRMVENYRPTQALNDRTVRSTFRKFFT